MCRCFMGTYFGIKKVEEEFIKDIKYRLQKSEKILGFNSEELAEWMFTDVLFLHYTNMIADEHRCNVIIDNLRLEKDSYIGNATKKKAVFTTYIKCETRYKRLFGDNTAFLESDTGKWLRKKYQHKRVAYIKAIDIIFSIYVLNKLYLNSADKKNAIKNVLEKRFTIQNPTYSLQWIFYKVYGKQEGNIYLIQYTGEFWRDFCIQRELNKFTDIEYIILITNIHSLLTSLFCTYAGLFVGNSLIMDIKPTILNTLNSYNVESVPSKKAVELIRKRFYTIEKNSDFNADKESFKEIIRNQIETYADLVNQYNEKIEPIKQSDIDIREIEKAIHKVYKECYPDRDRRKQKALLNNFYIFKTKKLDLTDIKEFAKLIDDVSYLSPKDAKKLLWSVRENIVKITNQAKGSNWLCAEVFKQVYHLCSFFSKGVLSESYHKDNMLENIAQLLLSNMELSDGDSVTLLDYITEALASAYRVKIYDIIANSDSSDYGFIHSFLFIINSVKDFALNCYDIYPLNYKGWIILSNFIFSECSKLYDDLEKYFNLDKKNRKQLLKQYLDKEDVITRSHEYLRTVCIDNYGKEMVVYLRLAF